ncbi:substrate-binding domain-containing protein [Actinoplanes sp. NPDC024001]|uniref:substrate-binding domain-containing protein n=1 Tax=Actinoplanes sp. NPDC024001 TaxID=3154598 RepID=UPI003403B694
MRQPAADLGAAAVRLVLDEMGHPERTPQDIVFQPELVIRESTTTRAQPWRGCRR